MHLDTFTTPNMHWSFIEKYTSWYEALNHEYDVIIYESWGSEYVTDK